MTLSFCSTHIYDWRHAKTKKLSKKMKNDYLFLFCAIFGQRQDPWQTVINLLSQLCMYTCKETHNQHTKVSTLFFYLWLLTYYIKVTVTFVTIFHTLNSMLIFTRMLSSAAAYYPPSPPSLSPQPPCRCQYTDTSSAQTIYIWYIYLSRLHFVWQYAPEDKANVPENVQVIKFQTKNIV